MHAHEDESANLLAIEYGEPRLPHANRFGVRACGALTTYLGTGRITGTTLLNNVT